MLRTWTFVWLAAPLLVASGCVTDSGAGGAADADSEEKLMFDCKPEAGSPHQMIHVLVATGDSAEAGPADADDKEDKDDKDDATPQQAAGEPTDEEAVVIATNERESGQAGHCATRTDTKAGGTRYSCITADGGLTLAWPVGKQTADGKVEVSEKWLIGFRHYGATCTKKA